MDQIDLIVEKRAAIKATCEKYGATAVRIFGSCAKNDYNEKSDIDVLVHMPSDLRGFYYYGCLGELKDELETVLGVKVDLVDEANLKGQARERILQEAISL